VDGRETIDCKGPEEKLDFAYPFGWVVPNRTEEAGLFHSGKRLFLRVFAKRENSFPFN
jgi:hypothetical protein